MSRNSQNSEDSVEYVISVETRVVAYNYKEGKIGPAACDHLHTGRTHPHAAHSTSVVGKTRSTTMKYSSMLEALIDDWPNVPVGIMWGWWPSPSRRWWHAACGCVFSGQARYGTMEKSRASSSKTAAMIPRGEKGRTLPNASICYRQSKGHSLHKPYSRAFLARLL